MFGHACPEHTSAFGPEAGPNSASSKIFLIINGLTTPSPDERTIAIPTTATCRR